MSIAIAIAVVVCRNIVYEHLILSRRLMACHLQSNVIWVKRMPLGYHRLQVCSHNVLLNTLF